MRRSVKWTILITVFCLIVLAIGCLVYFCVFHKDNYHIVAVEHTSYQASEFKNSELKFFNNGTFHVKIVHGEDELFFLGLGTYTKKGATYHLTFTQAIGRQGETITNQLDKFGEPLACPKSGNRISFVDHNHQVYYFG